MSNNRINIKKAFIFILPFILGTYGLFWLEHIPLQDALFSSVAMYFLNYGDTPANIYIEIARWTAPLMTASGIIFAVSVLHTRWHNWIIYLRGGSIAVYGEPEQTADVLNELGRKGIKGKESFVKADRYILLDDESKNFSFYRTNQSRLAGKTVYLECSSLQAQTVIGGDLKLFCPEETAARLFWKQARLYQQSCDSDHQLKIVILGFGKLGEELLLWGLQDNLFSPDQLIEYHIFGDSGGFSCMHREMDSIGDKVYFHKEEWYQNLSLMRDADRIILCTQASQTELLKDLLFTIPVKIFDVFMAEDASVDFLEAQERIRLFPWRREALRLSNLLDEPLLERAKRINLRYSHIYMGVPEDDKTKEAEWKKLDSFTRYSNISSADYHEVRLQMLETWGIPADKHSSDNKLLSELTSAQMELLAELEHIRWCRYHYLNNWTYGVPANGKNKDKNLRIHTDLIPYDSLSEEDKEKDRENIRILLNIIMN